MSRSPQLASRLSTGHRGRLCIISPHLDDAAFSALAALLAAGFEERLVVSVVTESGPSGGEQWARSAGFADPAAEFQARRDEDRRALASIGAGAHHLGVPTGSSSGQIGTAIRAFLGTETAVIGQTLYLLPAGAGGRYLRGGPRRWLSRVLRRPLGAPAHPEHVSVRDALVVALRGAADASFGFYGEQPYVWNSSATQLREELERLAGQPMEVILGMPDPESKLRLARMYGSQFAPIFGNSASFQRRALCRPEEYYLAS